MTEIAFLPSALLDAVSIFIIGISVLMIAVHVVMLAWAAQRTVLSRRQQMITPLMAAMVLSTWAAWAFTAVKESVVVAAAEPMGNQPMLLINMAGLFGVGALLMVVPKTMRAINAAMPLSWLIGVQVYRVAGAVFLWPFLSYHVLPAGFALPAGIGDTLTGLAAPWVAWAVARRQPGAQRWAVAWNIFGLLDLVVAPVAAVLSETTNIARFPIVIVPLFLGPPLGILTHIYSLQNLYRNRRSADPSLYLKAAAQVRPL